MKNLFYVGQEVYILNREGKLPGVLETAVVEKVGRKYLTVKGKWNVFEFELGHTENGVVKLPRKVDRYNHLMYLFLAKEDAENELTRHIMTLKLYRSLDIFLLQKMSLEDLQKIEEIIDKYMEEEN